MASQDDEQLRFASAVRALGALDEAKLAEFLRELPAGPPGSLLTSLLQRGLVSASVWDQIDLLMRGDTAIPGYRLLRRLGAGGMGVVWLAEQTSLQRSVALKTISCDASEGAQLAERFMREAAVVARLSHSNIVTAIDFGQHAGRLYLSMEYVSGVDLNAYIKTHGPLSERVAWLIGRQIASGLAHAHHHGVTHRDIKPANILVLQDGVATHLAAEAPTVKITDFGLALMQATDIADDRLTSVHATVGSPHYMAPEQFGRQEISPRTDIYALGATVYQMLTGKPPWSGGSLPEIIRQKMAPTTPQAIDLGPQFSPATRDLVARMMASDGEQRPQDCPALLQEIDRVLAESPRDDSTTTLKVSGVAEGPPKSLEETIILDTPSPLLSNASKGSGSHLAPATHGAELQVRKRAHRYYWAAGLCLVFVMALGVARYWPLAPVVAPLPLRLTGEQQLLFDGSQLRSPLLLNQLGGWIATDGRLTHVSGEAAELTYRLPDWPYLVAELTLSDLKGHTVDILFAEDFPDARGVRRGGRRHGVRITEGYATVGTFAGNGGTFTEIGPRHPLAAAREFHFLELEQNRACWVVRLYRDPNLAWVVPTGMVAEGERAEPSRLEIRSSKGPPGEDADASEIAGLALSEMSVWRMEPKGDASAVDTPSVRRSVVQWSI